MAWQTKRSLRAELKEARYWCDYRHGQQQRYFELMHAARADGREKDKMISALCAEILNTEPDTSDIPEVGEEWFARARFTYHGATSGRWVASSHNALDQTLKAIERSSFVDQEIGFPSEWDTRRYRK